MLVRGVDARRWIWAGLFLVLPWSGAFSQDAPESAVQPTSATLFRQQAPIGATTGDARELARRIMGATRYLATPGDVYEFKVRIGDLQTFLLVLPQDFVLEVPFLGSIDVRGRVFSGLRTEIISRIKARVPAEFVSFELAAPALFDIFAFGGVARPGIYTATPLSRVSDIITLAGGPQAGASLRRVELIRSPDTLLIDLTRFSSLGDLEANPTVEPNDRIRVPRVARLITVAGEVHFPGVFDLLEDETLSDVLAFAGGPKQGADLDRITVSRSLGANIQSFDVDRDQYGDFVLEPGDTVRVPAATRAEAMVTVRGALFGQPIAGNTTLTIPTNELLLHVPFRTGLTALNVLDALGGPTPLAAETGGVVFRDQGAVRHELDVQALWKTRSASLDIQLAPGDEMHVPMQNLFVYVGGEVNAPLAVPFSLGFTVADYIRAAGGVSEDGGPRVIALGPDNQPVAVDIGYRPPAGTSLLVARSAWGETKQVITNVTIVAGFLTTAYALYTGVVAPLLGLPTP